MIRLKCPKCNYEWNYRGKLFMACCPNCLKKVPTKSLAVEKRKETKKSTIASDVERAKKIIGEEKCVEEQELFARLQVGINKFYWIKKILASDDELEVKDGFFALKGLAPQKTLGVR
jgi:uncharacterized Zn finger protein (UPF0148 family)